MTSIGLVVEADLKISWNGIWKNIKVEVENETVGSFENQKELKQGKSFKLFDGSELAVQLKQVCRQ